MSKWTDWKVAFTNMQTGCEIERRESAVGGAMRKSIMYRVKGRVFHDFPEAARASCDHDNAVWEYFLLRVKGSGPILCTPKGSPVRLRGVTDTATLAQHAISLNAKRSVNMISERAIQKRKEYSIADWQRWRETIRRRMIEQAKAKLKAEKQREQEVRSLGDVPGSW